MGKNRREARRTILHVDMDAFFASVEQRDHPELRGRAVIVGAPRDQRGVVATASYEARKFGVHSAMPSREAGRRCPHAVFLPVNGRRYAEVSRQVFDILERFTPYVEPVSIDEAFLDVTGSRRLYGDGRDIAKSIKDVIRRETELTASVGVAPNKFLAKLASDTEKPDGLTMVPTEPDRILAFLAPLAVGRIPGVGKVTKAQLEKVGLASVGDLQRASVRHLSAIVGESSARYLQTLARGEDAREIVLSHIEQQISREHTFVQDCELSSRIEDVLCDLVEEVGNQLREGCRYASLAHLKLRWKSFDTITRQKRIGHPCCDDFTLRELALRLFRAQKLIQPVRLIGFGVSRLTDAWGEEPDLFPAESGRLRRKERLSRAIDQVRRKFGNRAIRRASKTE